MLSYQPRSDSLLDDSISGDDLRSNNIVDSEEKEKEVTQFGFAGKETLKLDHRQFDHTKYEKLYI